MLDRIVYRSIVCFGGDVELSRILTVALWANARHQITGALGVAGGHFFQVLEGPPPALDQLLDNLERDRRHEQMVVLREKNVAHRLFPGWTMARVDLDDFAPSLRERFEAGDLDGAAAVMHGLWLEGLTGVA